MYEWDQEKSANNKKKHGISFDEARNSIFEGPNLLAINVTTESEEERHAVIGRHKGKFFTAIFTIRSFKFRIISVRRSRREEEEQAKKAGL